MAIEALNLNEITHSAKNYRFKLDPADAFFIAILSG